jgi:hypothetical protein
MSLTVREQQALEELASRLARSDPTLAAKLAIFSRLTSGEEMPVRESARLTCGSAGESTCRPGGAGSRPALGARLLYRHLGLPGVAALVWLVIAVALIAVAVTITGGTKGTGTCTASWPVPCAARSASTPR